MAQKLYVKTAIEESVFIKLKAAAKKRNIGMAKLIEEMLILNEKGSTNNSEASQS
jgi:hypothetical protein